MPAPRLAALTTATVLLAGLGVSACGRSPAAVPTPAPATSISGLGLAEFPPDERPLAPPISGTTLDGETWDLADQRGTPVVINAWASWCAPCRDELPALVSLSASYADVSFVGLNVNDTRDEALAMESEFGVGYPSIVDRGGRLLVGIPAVPPQSLPVTVIVDREGRIAARVIGPVKPGILDPVLDRLAAETGGAASASRD